MRKHLLAGAVLLVASAANADSKFDPFLYWTDLDSSYQGIGLLWAVMKSRGKETRNKQNVRPRRQLKSDKPPMVILLLV
jgi:hypothetical protein